MRQSYQLIIQISICNFNVECIYSMTYKYWSILWLGGHHATILVVAVAFLLPLLDVAVELYQYPYIAYSIVCGYI